MQSVGRDGTKDIAFTVSRDSAKEVAKLLETSLDFARDAQIVCDTDVAKISIVGAGMQTHADTASKMFGALYRNDINIEMIAASEIKISVLISAKDAERAVEAVHDAFMNE